MIYRFKIWFEDDDEIIRWIDMKPNHTFKDFHTAILNAIEFKDMEPASFFLSNDRWAKGLEITLEDMGFEDAETPKNLMQDCLLKKHINDPHQKFIYINDFMQMWTLHIELQNIIAEDAKDVTYPFLYKSIGKAPKQNTGIIDMPLIEDTEFDSIAEQLIKEKGGRHISDPDFEDGIDFDDDEEEDEDEDDFGPEYGDEYDEKDSY
ncbi:MAG: plasmid pRiA4b ORF-3 family protein [Bacteroidia bacterium]|nr:plasmid pRiA4b ORF-3 family protein [Bacteroidia bacterium]